jgi:hypothetical protein
MRVDSNTAGSPAFLAETVPAADQAAQEPDRNEAQRGRVMTGFRPAQADAQGHSAERVRRSAHLAASASQGAGANPVIEALVNDVRHRIPDPHRSASKLIGKLINKEPGVIKSGARVDPDRTAIVSYVYNQSDHPYPAQVTDRISLSDALIRNVRSYSAPASSWYEGGPRVKFTDKLEDAPIGVGVPRGATTRYAYTGIYELGPDGKLDAQLDGGKQVPVSPYRVAQLTWTAGFPKKFEKEIQNFWSAHRSDYAKVDKAAFIKTAFAQHAAGKLDDTDLDLVRQYTQIPASKNWADTDTADLERPVAPGHDVKAGLLTMHRYPSTDLAVIQGRDRVLLSIPGHTTPMQSFKTMNEMRSWIADEVRDPGKRAEFANHFKLKDRPDGFVHIGVDTLLSEFAKWATPSRPGEQPHGSPAGVAWNPQKYITNEAAHDIFAETTRRTEERSLDDAKTRITSQGDVTKKRILEGLEVASYALAPLAIFAPPVAVAAGAAIAAARVGIGADNLRHGKPEGSEQIASGVIDVLPDVAGGVIGAAKKAGAAGAKAAKTVAKTSGNGGEAAARTPVAAPGKLPAPPLPDTPRGGEGTLACLSSPPCSPAASAATTVSGGVSQAPPPGTGFHARALPQGATPQPDGLYVIDGQRYARFQDRDELLAVGTGPDRHIRLIAGPQGRPVGPVVAETSRKGYYASSFLESAGDPHSARPVPASDFALSTEDENAIHAYWSGTASANDPHVQAAYSHVPGKHQALMEDAYRELPKAQRPRVAQAQLPANANDDEVMAGMLDGANGLVIGEDHSLPYGRQFLIDTMATAEKHGVRRLYLEIPRERFGQELTDFMLGGELTPALKSFDQMGGKPTMSDVLLAARQRNFEIHLMDSEAARYANQADNIENRVYAFNHLAQLEINGNPNGKYLVLTGGLHADNSVFGGIRIPGIASTTGGRSLMVKGPSASPTSRKIEADPIQRIQGDGLQTAIRFDASIETAQRRPAAPLSPGGAGPSQPKRSRIGS